MGFKVRYKCNVFVINNSSSFIWVFFWGNMELRLTTIILRDLN
jgi:hypothetical protein